jgi:hypothetical protein
MARQRSAVVLVVLAVLAVSLLVGIWPMPSHYDGNNEMRGRFTGWWQWFSPDGRKPLPCRWSWTMEGDIGHHERPPQDTDGWTAYQ